MGKGSTARKSAALAFLEDHLNGSPPLKLFPLIRITYELIGPRSTCGPVDESATTSAHRLQAVSHVSKRLGDAQRSKTSRRSSRHASVYAHRLLTGRPDAGPARDDPRASWWWLLPKLTGCDTGVRPMKIKWTKFLHNASRLSRHLEWRSHHELFTYPLRDGHAKFWTETWLLNHAKLAW